MSALNTHQPDGTSASRGPSWRSYVMYQGGPVVHPVAVREVAGRVSGADDFLAGAGPLVLRADHGGEAPSVVLDYGVNVAGVPWLEVTAADGAPTLRVSYAESARWIGPDGDVSGGHTDSASRTRVETHVVEAPGLFGRGSVQGGQRYQRIALESVGAVEISRVGMNIAAELATADDYEGWFVSSSELINRIWYDGARTVQVNQLPANLLPVPWRIGNGCLEVRGGTMAVLRDRAFGDAIIEFEAALVERAIGWLVRALDDGARGLLCCIQQGDEGPPTPDLLLR